MPVNLSMTEMLIEEFKEEAKSTRRLLERIPVDKLSWSPHSKSMSLGTLALHIAVIPGELAKFLDKLDQETPVVPLPEASSLEEILSAFERNESTAIEHISSWDEEHLMAEWKMFHKEEIIMTTPRIVMLRTILLNHWYHHRGQLTVYLRLLNIPVPAIYGSSADEDSFQ